MGSFCVFTNGFSLSGFCELFGMYRGPIIFRLWSLIHFFCSFFFCKYWISQLVPSPSPPAIYCRPPSWLQFYLTVWLKDFAIDLQHETFISFLRSETQFGRVEGLHPSWKTCSCTDLYKKYRHFVGNEHCSLGASDESVTLAWGSCSDYSVKMSDNQATQLTSTVKYNQMYIAFLMHPRGRLTLKETIYITLQLYRGVTEA